MRRFTLKRGNLFSQGRLQDFIDKRKKDIKTEIGNETDDYILNISETSYIDSLEAKYIIAIPIIEYEDLCIDSYEAEVSVEHLPSYARYDHTGYVKREIYCLYIPVTGNIEILRYCPNTMIGGNGDFEIKHSQLTLEYLTFTDSPDEIKRHFDSAIGQIKKMYGYLKSDIESYNMGTREIIKQEYDTRKSQLLKRNQLLASIGFPLKEKKESSKTFSIPPPKLRESIKIKPIVSEKGYKPEPTMDDETYNKILKIIDDSGKNFERMPSLYANKYEEDLRDHILFVLDPHFENGSASGETFNKRGKTDIQIRHDSSVIFIAECKFWKGEKAYLETINQLLRYLTWRDTKTSIIIFVRQKNITQIIQKIKESTPNHPNYKRLVTHSVSNWINYLFHINDDLNRDIKLAVQIFHIPEQ